MSCMLVVVLALTSVGVAAAQAPAKHDTVSAKAAPTKIAMAKTAPSNDSVSIRIMDLDVRTAIQSLAQYLDRPVVFGPLNAAKVTLETPRPVARSQVYSFLQGMLDSQGMEIAPDSSGLYRVRMKGGRPPADNLTAPVPEPVLRPMNAPSGPTTLYTIRLSHARATDVASTVNALYGRGYMGYGDMSGRAATLQQQLQQHQLQPQFPSAGGGMSNGYPQNGYPPMQNGYNGYNGYNGQQNQQTNSPLSADATIIPDPSTNSLLVRASKADYDLIVAAVKELDVRPLQVLIEVLIAEVRRDRSLAFGIDIKLGETSIKGTDSKISGSNTGLGLGDFALKLMGYKNYDVDAVLRAAASRGDAKIMSRPIVVAANNEEADILVGSQRPFVQVSRSLPTDTPARDQVVQYKDVGTRLSVRPTVSSDGYVMLQVTQEVNQATAETQFDAPIISTRSVQTKLLVRDGQTIVLGGLMDREKEQHREGIPFFSSIPLIGGFFGHASRTSVENELFIFLIPHVLSTDEDAAKVTAPYRERARSNEP